MIRGFVTGVIWGGVVATMGLAVVSQVAPLPMPGAVAEGTVSPAVVPQPEALTGVDLPQDTAPDAAGDTPDQAGGPVGAEPGAALPEAVNPEAAPDATADAALEAAPDTAPSDALQPEILQKGPAPSAGGDSPATDAPLPTQEPVPPPVADAGAEPAAPAVVPEDAAPAEPDLVVEPEKAVVEQQLAQPGPVDGTAPAAPAMPPTPETDIAIPGRMAEAAPGLAGAEMPALPGDEAAPVHTDIPPAGDEALLQPAPAEDALPEPAIIVPDAPLPTVPESTAPETDGPDETMLAVPGVRTDRLPRIGDDPAPAEGDAGPDGVDGAALPDAVLGTTPLELFRRDFDNPDAKPLFGIVLIDEGIPAEERSRLAALPFAISFALDPLAADSADAARIYRAAGQEVVMLASGIPQGATASDLEQTFQALDMSMPEAVAVLDRMDGGFQDTLDLARQAVPIVAEQGRGIITYDRGLNSADQVARREGVPRATIFRVLDGEGESIPKMRNYLDRAAFKAAQEGRVLVIGRARAETVAAILEWTVEGRAASVALAPVSSVLETAPSP